MDGTGLTDQERRILAGIEHSARRNDAVLDLKLRTMRRWPAPATQLRESLRKRLGGALLCSMATLSAVLLVLAITTSAPALVPAFAVTWVLTLLCAVRYLCRWSRRMSGRSDRDPRADRRAGRRG
jgi:hypothetical protein